MTYENIEIINKNIYTIIKQHTNIKNEGIETVLSFIFLKELSIKVNKNIEEIINEENIGVLENVNFYNNYKLIDEIQKEKIKKELNKIEINEIDLLNESYMALISNFKDVNNKNGEFFTPEELSFLSSEILDIKEGSTIFDPAAGSSSLLLKAYKNNCFLYSNEREELSTYLQEMNYILNNIKNYKIINSDAILEYDNKLKELKGKIDFIVSNPPYGVKDYGINEVNKESEIFNFGLPKKGEIEYAFTNLILTLLKDNGRASVILPLGFLFKDINKKIREEYIKNNFIEGIILLPSNMFKNTSIPVCIVVFNKDNKSDSIFMINSSEDFEKKGKFNIVNFNKIIDIYKRKKEIEGYSKKINLKTIIDNDFNLSVNRYVFEEEKDEYIDIFKLLQEEDELKRKIDRLQKENDEVFKKIGELYNEKRLQN